MPSEDHFARLARLLELESQAEAERWRERARRLSGADAERSGESLVELAVDEVSAGLGGRYVLRLVKRNRTLALPWTRLGPGTPVLLAPDDRRAKLAFRGVVVERDERAVCVALGDLPDELDEHDLWRLDVSSDEISRQRQRAALQQAAAAKGPAAVLRQICLVQREPRSGAVRPLAPRDASLNASQRQAVEFALAAEDLAILHGPPGTGKTTTVVELVRQSVALDQRVLCCAPSNLGVDNLMEKLLAAGVRAVRLGHPARVLAGLRAQTLDLLVDRHEDVQVARGLVREAVGLRRKAARWTRAKPQPGERARLREQARELSSDARRLEQLAVEHVLDQAQVLCATLTGLDEQLLTGRQFDLLVIDEAGQAVEPAAWIALVRARKVVLAGDHCQLPPTILSAAAAAQGLGVSLLERLATARGEWSRLLVTQYRMHRAIMEFSSRMFYDGRLEADAAVADRLLADLPGVARNELTDSPLRLIDTAGAGYDEQLEPDGESRLNPPEAELAARQVERLLEAGVDAGQIALVAPYAAQVRLLRQRLPIAGLEVDSVDGFQGREKEAVVISLVRSNAGGDVGFLNDTRRMNVALTRARRKLIVIGDGATLAGHPFYAELWNHFEASGGYHTVWEEPA